MTMLQTYHQITVDVSLDSAIEAAREHAHAGAVVCANPTGTMAIFAKLAEPDVFNVKRSHACVEMRNGARVFFIRAGEEDRLRGRDLDWVWSESGTPEALRRRLVDPSYRTAVHLDPLPKTTPTRSLYDQFIAPRNGRPGACSYPCQQIPRRNGSINFSPPSSGFVQRVSHESSSASNPVSRQQARPRIRDSGRRSRPTSTNAIRAVRRFRGNNNRRRARSPRRTIRDRRQS